VPGRWAAYSPRDCRRVGTTFRFWRGGQRLDDLREHGGVLVDGAGSMSRLGVTDLAPSLTRQDIVAKEKFGYE
jgi:hypothetical protein